MEKKYKATLLTVLNSKGKSQKKLLIIKKKDINKYLKQTGSNTGKFTGKFPIDLLPAVNTAAPIKSTTNAQLYSLSSFASLNKHITHDITADEKPLKDPTGHNAGKTIVDEKCLENVNECLTTDKITACKSLEIFSENVTNVAISEKALEDINKQITNTTSTDEVQLEMFNCQLCSEEFKDQLQFFLHLKSHYEPSPRIMNKEENKNEISIEKIDSKRKNNAYLQNVHCIQCNKSFKSRRAYDSHVQEVHIKVELNEFSDHEDIMDGIEVNEFEEVYWDDET